MPIIYRTTPYDDNYLTYLNKLWEENWIFSGQIWDKLVFRKEVKKTVTRTTAVEDDRFQEFYWVYPNKKNRQWAVKEWCKLSDEDKTQAIQTAPIYKKWCEHKYTENGKLVKDKILHPDTYLRNKRWNDEIEIDWKSKSDIIKEKEIKKVFSFQIISNFMIFSDAEGKVVMKFKRRVAEEFSKNLN